MNRFILQAIAFCALIAPSCFATELDLEEKTSDFVLEIKQIIIPERPHAFNPSITRWQGRFLLSFREIVNITQEPIANSAGDSNIGLVWLDDNFNPVDKAQVIFLDLPEDGIHYCRYEDPRFIIVDHHLYLVYSNNENSWISEGGFRVYISEIDFDGNSFYVIDNERLSYFEGENEDRREKNWVPFDYQGTFLLAYTLDPHNIFFPYMMGSESCETVATSTTKASWQWGDLRGGTPAIQIDSDRYLAFFHSCVDLSSVQSKGKKALHYFVGAYTFSAHPPFEIEAISPEPIIAEGFYSGETYEPYWKPVKAVFPCGILADEQFVWMTYGRDDHECWIAKIDRQALLDSLIPLSKEQEIIYEEAKKKLKQ